MPLDAQASRVRLLLFDVDGVLTDGTILVHSDGTESKRFSIRDGLGLVYAQKAGLLVGLLSARASEVTRRRAEELGIPIVRQDTTMDKLSTYEAILAEHALGDEEVAFMGDDILDLPVLRRVGLSACPADAAAEVRTRVAWIAPSNGGHGAARDLIELVMRARGDWDAIVRRHAGEATP